MKESVKDIILRAKSRGHKGVLLYEMYKEQVARLNLEPNEYEEAMKKLAEVLSV